MWAFQGQRVRRRPWGSLDIYKMSGMVEIGHGNMEEGKLLKYLHCRSINFFCKGCKHCNQGGGSQYLKLANNLLLLQASLDLVLNYHHRKYGICYGRPKAVNGKHKNYHMEYTAAECLGLLVMTEIPVVRACQLHSRSLYACGLTITTYCNWHKITEIRLFYPCPIWSLGETKLRSELSDAGKS
eukprot:Gb_15939 [translate_table: standard]